MNFYTYKAKLIKIVDCDTIDINLDLGFEIYKKARCRLAGINAPELRTAEGKAAKQFLVDTIPLGSDIIIESKKYDKYGRSLAVVYYNNDSENKSFLININNLIVEKGFAIRYME